MTTQQFRALRIGDQVTLAVPRPDYTSGHRTPDGRIYVPAGTVGTVAAVNVPYVTGPDRKKRGFTCVDFSVCTTQFRDVFGRPVSHWARLDGKTRCSVIADQLSPTSPSLARLFENLENGNLTDAKRAARRHSTFQLSMFARQILFWSFDRSVAAAQFLKGENTFQNFCDTK